MSKDHDDKQLRKKLDETPGDPIIRIVGHALVAIVTELYIMNSHLEKSAKALDYISNHLNEVGR